MKNNTRHTMDFQVMPDLIGKSGSTFVKRCLKEKERHICEIYNYFFQKVFKNFQITYNEKDFCISDHKMSGHQRILYISLPPKHDDSTVFCTAYAVFYEKNLFGIGNTQFYTVEASVFNTTCIGTMSPDGTHLNFGEAYPTREQNLQAIYLQASTLKK